MSSCEQQQQAQAQAHAHRAAVAVLDTHHETRRHLDNSSRHYQLAKVTPTSTPPLMALPLCHAYL